MLLLFLLFLLMVGVKFLEGGYFAVLNRLCRLCRKTCSIWSIDGSLVRSLSLGDECGLGLEVRILKVKSFLLLIK